MSKKLTIEEAGDKVVLTYWTKENACLAIIARIVVNATDDFLYDAISATDDLATKIARDGFYTGRVVCTYSDLHNFTVGRIYQFENGYTVDNYGKIYPFNPVYSIKDAENNFIKFCQLIDE